MTSTAAFPDTVTRLFAELIDRDPSGATVAVKLFAEVSNCGLPEERRRFASECVMRWLEFVAPELHTFIRQSEGLASLRNAGAPEQFWAETNDDIDRKREIRAREFSPTALQSPLGELVREEERDARLFGATGGRAADAAERLGA